MPGYAPVVQLSALNGAVVTLYNRMRGINWPALPVMLAIEGIDDVELAVHQLIALDRALREEKDG